MAIILDVAATHLLHRKRQSIVSIMGVALGVGFFIGASSLLNGSQQDLIERLVNTQPHIVIKDEFRTPPPQPVVAVYPRGAVELRSAKPRESIRGIKDSPGKLAALERQEGAAVAPALSGQAILRYGSKDLSASITGIDPDREPYVSKLAEDMIKGRIADLKTAANGIILGDQLAANLGATAGDTLTVTSPAGVVLKMKIVGLFRTGVTAVDRSTSYTLLKKAQVLQDRPNVVNQIRIRLENHELARDLAADIEARYRYRTESWQESNEDFLGLLTIRNMIMYSIVTAILIVASFGIYNIISTVVHEKARDIAILKSMGFESADIRRIFLLEGTLVGLVGTAVGWAIGAGIIWGMGAIPLKIGGIVEVQHFPMDYALWHYGVAGGFATIAATLAAYLPARKAAGVRPVEILRGAA